MTAILKFYNLVLFSVWSRIVNILYMIHSIISLSIKKEQTLNAWHYVLHTLNISNCGEVHSRNVF